MAKDYYLILGVPLDASPDEIRSAFRRLALRHHPDRGGESGPGVFQNISEAYDVLSDPAQRAKYDREQRRRGRLGPVVPVSSRACDPEPLTRKAGREEPLNFELILTPEEAEHGMLVPFQVPVLSTCYECGGLGRCWLFPCTVCNGEGRLVDRDAVGVRVPAGVRDGTVIEVSLESLGIQNRWLRMYVRVERL